MELIGKITAFLLKYRYVVLILVIGLVLMLIPFGLKTTLDFKVTHR